MFMRKKGEYWQIVENRRVDGKVRQRVIASLGRDGDLPKTIAILTRQLEVYKEGIPRLRDPNRNLRSRMAVSAHLWQKYLYEAADKLQPAHPWPQGFIPDTWKKYAAQAPEMITARLKAKHEACVTGLYRAMASLQSRLAKIWAAIPEEQRQEVIQEAMAYGAVVPEEWSRPARPLNCGTTETPNTVVPELVGRPTSLGTTAQDNLPSAGAAE